MRLFGHGAEGIPFRLVDAWCAEQGKCAVYFAQFADVF